MSVIICLQLALGVNDFPSRNTKEWPYLVCNAGDLQMGITHTHLTNQPTHSMRYRGFGSICGNRLNSVHTSQGRWC